LFSNKPHLKQKLHSFGQQALSVTTRLSDIKRAGVRREAELYVRLGELNRQLVDMEAAHLALQHSRDELVRSKTRDGERIAELQQQVASLETQRSDVWQRVRELEASLAGAQARQADSEARFDALRSRLERERDDLQQDLERAQDALAGSRQELQELRTHGSRVLEAMYQAQRLADQSGAAARELDRYLEHSARLLHPAAAGDTADSGASLDPQPSMVQRLKSGLTGEGLLASRQLRIVAGVPLLLGALASAKVAWDAGDETQQREGAGPVGTEMADTSFSAHEANGETLEEALATLVPADAETHSGQRHAPVIRQARAALAALENASSALSVQRDFDPQVQRQQRDLLALGFDLGHSRADGVMGARTEQALQEFEALYLPATGLQSLSGQGQLGSLVETVARRAREDGAQLNISSDVLAAIQLSHLRTGIEFSYLAELAAVESRFDPATRSASSTAAGLYQFTEDTWLQVLRAHGDKYGLSEHARQIEYVPNGAGGGRLTVNDEQWRQQLLDMRYNARISALMAAEFASDNRRKLVSALGREVTSTDLYFAHFLGVADAIAFLSLLQVMPDETAGKLFPAAASANGSIFYPADEAPRTVAEVYALFDRKFNTGRYQAWDLALMLAEAGQ